MGVPQAAIDVLELGRGARDAGQSDLTRAAPGTAVVGAVIVGAGLMVAILVGVLLLGDFLTGTVLSGAVLARTAAEEAVLIVGVLAGAFLAHG